MKIKRSKALLTLFIGIYGLSLAFFIIENADMRRHIPVENKQTGGVIIIDNVKYKTPYQVQRAQIGVTVKNPIDFLFLSTDEQQESFIGAIAKLAIVVLAINFLWRTDFAQPFQPAYVKRARFIFIMFIILVVLVWIKNIYTADCVSLYLHSSTYRYQESITGINLYFTIIICGTLLKLFQQAVENREELELTI